MADIGVRYEYNTFKYFERGELQPHQSKQLHDLSPSIQLMYQGTIPLSLSYRSFVLRPTYSQLSERHQYNNKYLYEGGNKYLTPGHKDVVQLGTQVGGFMIGLEYTHVRDHVLFVTKYDSQIDIALSRPYNIPHTHQINLQAE